MRIQTTAFKGGAHRNWKKPRPRTRELKTTQDSAKIDDIAKRHARQKHLHTSCRSDAIGLGRLFVTTGPMCLAMPAEMVAMPATRARSHSRVPRTAPGENVGFETGA